MTRSTLGYIGLFLVAAFITAVANLPLYLVVQAAGLPLQAERISGTIWKGQIENAWITGYPVGDVAVNAKLWPLLQGRLAADINLQGVIATGSSRVSVGMRRISFQNADFSVNISPLNLRDAFDAPMSGEVLLKSPSLTISPIACVEGTLSLTTDTLTKTAVRYGGEGFVLSGEGACEENAFLLPLKGEGPEGRVDATIRVSAEGYFTELNIEPTDRRLAGALELYGFQQQGNAFSLVQRGTLF
ncbi:MAG: type II secretion system protein N [Pseudomonadota bacterium]